MALFINVAPGEAVRIGDATITVEAKTGKSARLRVDAPKDTDIHHLKAGESMPAPRVASAPAGIPVLQRPRLTAVS